VNVNLLHRQAMKDSTESNADNRRVFVQGNEEDAQEEPLSPLEGKEVKEMGREGRDRKKGEFRSMTKMPKDTYINATALNVVSIPHNLNTVGKLDEHFSKFGHIINIEVLQSQKKAVVKFSSHAEALKAIKSPEAVLGNRFIKVFWVTDEDEIAEVKKAEAEKQKSQEEVAKFIEEKKKQKVEAAKAAKRKQDELVQKKLEQTKEKQKMLSKLIEMSKKPNLPNQTKSTILEQIKGLTQSIKTDLGTIAKPPSAIPPTPSSSAYLPTSSFKRQKIVQKPTKEQLDRDLDEVKRKHEDDHLAALHSKLESLQKEAKLLGIKDTLPGRGRGRGRGRAWIGRGRGRGAWGRGGGLILDNRTSSFKLSNLPEGNLNSDLLREHFGQFGEVVDVKIEAPDAIIKMDTRHNAELAIKKGATINEHQARITWLNEQADDMLVSQGPEDEGTAEEGETVVEELEFYRNDGGGASDSDNEEDTWRR